MQGVVMAADAAVHATHAPCEGGVVAGRPTHTFFPATHASYSLSHKRDFGSRLKALVLGRYREQSRCRLSWEKSVSLSTLSFALKGTPDQPVPHETTGYQPYVRFSR